MKKIYFWTLMIIVVAIYLTLSLFGASTSELISSPTSDILKIRVDILKSITEGVAIIVAGVWTYEIYIKNRYDHPYPKIQHRVEHVILENNTIYLSVYVTVTNEGKTKLDLAGGKIFIRQISPLPDEFTRAVNTALKNLKHEEILRGVHKEIFVDGGQRINWITVGDRRWEELRKGLKELEPGQTREIQFAFLLLEADIKVVEVISYFEYAKSSWELATLYSLRA